MTCKLNFHEIHGQVTRFIFILVSFPTKKRSTCKNIFERHIIFYAWRAVNVFILFWFVVTESNFFSKKKKKNLSDTWHVKQLKELIIFFTICKLNVTFKWKEFPKLFEQAFNCHAIKAKRITDIFLKLNVTLEIK